MRSWAAILIACFFAGSSSGALARYNQAASCGSVWQPGDHAAIVRVFDAPGPNGIADARVVFSPAGCSGTVRVLLHRADLPSGVLIVAVGVVRGRGVFRIDHTRRLRAPRTLRFVIRDLVRARIKTLYGGRSPMVEAMILGRRHELRSEIRDAFVSSGLAHLLAISGLHVGVVAALINMALRRLLHGAAPWGWSAAATWGYVALLGFPVPSTRAALFVTVAAWSRVRGRNPPLEVVIAVSMLCILLIDPLAVLSVGAWLSVCAVWSTARSVKLYDEVVAKRKLPKNRPLRLLAASAGATIVTAPITSLVFGNVAPIGVLANLIAVPLASMAVPAVFLSLVFGGIVASGAGTLLALLESVATLFGSIPGGHLEGVAGAAFALPWIVLASLVIWLAIRKPVLRLAVRRLLVGLGAAGWVVAVVPAVIPLGGRGMLEVHMLDVGQGDAIAIKTPNDHWVLVDGGPRTVTWDAGASVVLPFFKRQRVKFLDAAILSHGDADHLGGLPSVLQNVPTGIVLEPGMPLPSKLYVEFLGTLDREGTKWLSARAGDTLLVDSVSFVVLHPTHTWLDKNLGANENSLIVRVSYRQFDLLLTGDAGWPAESALVGSMMDIDVLKVGHHGSRGGTRNAWLEVLRPEVALISAGRRNRYGHPAPEVTSRLAAAGVRIYRTDLDGPVTLRSDGRYYEMLVRSRTPVTQRIMCLLPRSLRLSDSLSRNNVCSPKQRENSRVSFTISR